MSSIARTDLRSKPGYLVLEDSQLPDGRDFEGFLFGAEVSGASIRAASKDPAARFRDRGYGEAVFNTSMTGYQEILTDPSYYGQIVCMTVPHVGNTGVNSDDPESEHLWLAGFVIDELSPTPSNWRAQGDLDQYLRSHGIPAIHGVDTRALTRHLRTKGVVRGVIVPAHERSQAKALLAELPPFEGRDLIGEVTTRKPYIWNKHRNTASRFRVTAVDFGVKWNLLKSLESLGCEVEVVPATTTAKEILAKKPDGVFLSNGPGDPSAAPYAAEAIKQLIGKLPIFGVCMGHQILALALGGKTYKLKFGHRGGNQPVLDCHTQKVEISSHNHGYAVDAQSLPAEVEVTHHNLNDRTVEGLRVKGARAFSVQYHPEACPGPHDSFKLFEQFIKEMEEYRR